MDKVPFEVHCMIAYHVSQPTQEAGYALQQWLKEHPKAPSRQEGVRQLKALRLANKAFSVAATHYLFSDYQLLYLRQSFERLDAVSRHNTYSKQVRSLLYEPALLETYRCSNAWQICSPEASDLLDAIKTGAPTDMTVEQATEWLHQHAPQPYLDKTLEAMSRIRSAYDSYQGYLQDQTQNLQCRRNEVLLKSAIPRRSRLEHVTLRCVSIWSRNTSSAVHRALEIQWNPIHYGDYGNDRRLGVLELHSIFNAVFIAARIKTLECHQFSWRFLDASEPELHRMRWTFQWLQTLELNFFCSKSDEPLDSLASGSLVTLLAALRKLLRLSVSFPRNVGKTAALQHVVGDAYWPSLQEIKLGGIDITERELAPVLQKHAATLHTVSLGNIHLLKGNWTTILDCFRSTLKLREFHSFGGWSAREPVGRWWDVECYCCEDSDEPRLSDSHDVAMAIRSYVLYGAEFDIHQVLPQRRHPRR
jgi:hypothetical protein